MNSHLRFEVFRSSWTSWDSLFKEACDFADSVGRENVLNISHSCQGEGVVTVWYWAEESKGQSFERN